MDLSQAKKRQNQALAHKMMNIYQVESMSIDQKSELWTTPPQKTAPTHQFVTKVEITPESVLTAIAKLGPKTVAGVLNSADPLNPGGNFQAGVEGQEQMLCRNSFLYPELLKFKHGFYLENRKPAVAQVGVDALIYSHHVKVLRAGDEQTLLAPPRYVDVVTMAAPNYPGMVDSGHRALCVQTLTRRIRCGLRAFKAAGVPNLILAAWGCGRLKNPANLVAKLFHQVLAEEEFAGAFALVQFAIAGAPATLRAFEAEFNVAPRGK